MLLALRQHVLIAFMMSQVLLELNLALSKLQTLLPRFLNQELLLIILAMIAFQRNERLIAKISYYLQRYYYGLDLDIYG